MKAKSCPKCKTDIVKYSVNRQANTLVGNCPKCRKLVNLGRPDGSEQPAARASAATGKEKAGKEEKVEKTRAVQKGRERAAKRKAAPPANPPDHSRGVPAKRTGFRAALANFFEFD